MKKLLLALCTFFFVGANAQNDDVASITLKAGMEETKFSFKSANDFAENSDKIFENAQELMDTGSACGITIVISVKTPAEKSPNLDGKSITKWTNSTLQASCDKMEANAKQARDKALQELRG